VTAGAGIVAATLSFNRKCSALALTLASQDGRSATATLSRGQVLEVWHTGGSLTATVRGCSTSYTLTIVHPR
jgi:hypothetical protein